MSKSAKHRPSRIEKSENDEAVHFLLEEEHNALTGSSIWENNDEYFKRVPKRHLLDLLKLTFLHNRKDARKVLFALINPKKK